MPTQLTAETLRNLSLFADLSKSDVDALLPSFEELTYPADGVIFRKGEFDPALYVLLKGSVEISLDVPGSHDAVIVRLEPKGVFGESSFFHPAPHGATARCVSPSVALRLSHSEYQRLLQTGSMAATQLGTKAAQILAARLQATDHWVVELLAEEQQHVTANWRRFREKLGGSFDLPHGFMHAT